MNVMNDNEATLKDVIISIRDYLKELKQKVFLIFSFTILFLIIGYFYSLSREDTYVATISFIVEDNAEGFNLSSVSGMASQFGFDLGGNSSSSFSQQNVIELLKSRRIIESTLNQYSIISNVNSKLLNHYIEINNLIKDSLLININEKYIDSITTVVWMEIIKEKLNLTYQNDDASILNLNYVSLSPEFAKTFSEGLIHQMSEMYSEYQTEKTRFSLNNLQDRSDSIFNELQQAEKKLARVKDRNTRVITSSGRLDEIKYMREVKVLNAMYLEIVKNLEILKMTLLEDTPIIQVVDYPILPLQSLKRPTIFSMLIFGLLGMFIASFIVLLRKLIKDTLEEHA
tara:strand:- start:3751 stop:4776 length:1026 start_codon:yes stop_codon:yes gene_type:complete